MPKRKIRLPKLTGLFRSRPAARRPETAPIATVPTSRGRSRAKYGPEGKAARTRAQLADRAERRPVHQYGQRQSPRDTAYTRDHRGTAAPVGQSLVPRREQGEQSSHGTRNYPPRSESLRRTPEVRAGARFQLKERGDELAASRKRQPSGRTAREEIASRPRKGHQVHQYPAPYERAKAGLPPAPAKGRGRTVALPAHPARGHAPRPPAQLPGDVTPTGRMGGSMAGAGKPHPFFQKRG